MVSRTSRSKRLRACSLVWRLVPRPCEVAVGSFCLISRAIVRFCASTRSLAPWLMSFLRREINEVAAPKVLSRCGVDFAFALAFLVDFPNMDKSIGTFSEAATSVCARQESKGTVLACAKPFRMCEFFKWQWFFVGSHAGAMMTPILTPSSSALTCLSSSSLSCRIHPSVRHPSDRRSVTSVRHKRTHAQPTADQGGLQGFNPPSLFPLNLIPTPPPLPLFL